MAKHSFGDHGRADAEALLTDDEAAALLKLQPATLAAWRLRGHPALPFVRVGRCVRYRRRDVLAFIERHLAGTEAGGHVG